MALSKVLSKSSMQMPSLSVSSFENFYILEIAVPKVILAGRRSHVFVSNSHDLAMPTGNRQGQEHACPAQNQMLQPLSLLCS